jgi:hypothetical protein
MPSALLVVHKQKLGDDGTENNKKCFAKPR